MAVGRVEPRAARLWMRTPTPGPHRLLLWREGREAPVLEAQVDARPGPEDDGTWALTVPDDVPGAAPLEPLTRYRFALSVHEGLLVGTGHFRTPPEGPAQPSGRLAFAVSSCHQPFDRRGNWQAGARSMLRAVARTLEQEDAAFLLLCGDQVYADKPNGLSLFDPAYFRTVAPPGRASLLECTAGEVRALYQGRHRSFWGLPELQALQSRLPTLMVLDDHDVVDNFGSFPEHGSPAWAAFRLGVRQAIHDYQHLRVAPRTGAPPPSFAFPVEWGGVGVFTLDLRSERQAEGPPRILGPGQWEALDAWLTAHRDAEAVFLVCSVPIAYLPARATAALSRVLPGHDDVTDRWSHPQFLADRDRLLRRLLQHQREAQPGQRLVLLGGDVHVGYVHCLTWEGTDLPPIYQLTSSALSNQSPWVALKAASLLPRALSHVHPEGAPPLRVSMASGLAGQSQNPVASLNLGLVEVTREGGRTRVRLRLATPGRGAKRGALSVAFDTGPL